MRINANTPVRKVEDVACAFCRSQDLSLANLWGMAITITIYLKNYKSESFLFAVLVFPRSLVEAALELLRGVRSVLEYVQAEIQENILYLHLVL